MNLISLFPRRLRDSALGVLLLVCGTVPLLLGLSWAGSHYPWGAWQVWGLIGEGLIVMMLFFVNEARLERCNAEPIIEPSLFQNHVFSISLVVLSITFMGLFGDLVFLPLYIQGVLRISATNSGLLLTPMFLTVIIGTFITGQLITRQGKYKMLAVVGMGIMVVGAVQLLRLGITSCLIEVISAIVVMGLGVGMSLALYGTIVQSAFPQRIAQATSTLDFFQELSGPVALAVMGSIIAAVKLGLMQSLHTVFLVSLGILLVGLFVVVFLPEIKLQSAQPDTKE